MGDLRIYDTLTRRTETFVPREPGKVSMYACGLTPQAPPHVGHMRGVVFMDVVQRWLEQLGYEVLFVQNFTDIDDKIIRRAQEEGLTTEEVAAKYSKMYRDDAMELGIQPPKFVTVTEHMADIVAMIERLVDLGAAYQADGDVYFAVEKFEDYGKLSGRTIEEMISGARIEVDERKRHPGDFALWKAAKAGEPAWDSPWGRGRPGWHIECSALSLKYLGATFDIHAGGTDLIFPHHENEIAQSEAYLEGEPFAKYWMHWGAVRLDKEKMSKSTGHVVSIREALERYGPVVLRLYLMSTAYRKPMEFSFEKLDETKAAYERIRAAVSRAESWLTSHGELESPDDDSARAYRERFTAAMNDDFNTAGALGVVFELIGEINSGLAAIGSTGDAEGAKKWAALLEALRWMLKDALGIPLESETIADDGLIGPLMEKVIKWRQDLRYRKQFEIADQIRDDLKEIGLLLEDGAQGTSWRRA